MRERSFVEVLICAHRQLCGVAIRNKIHGHDSYRWKVFLFFGSDGDNTIKLLRLPSKRASFNQRQPICIPIQSRRCGFACLRTQLACFQLFAIFRFRNCMFVEFYRFPASAGKCVTDMLVSREKKPNTHKIPRTLYLVLCTRSANMSHAFVTNYLQKESQAFFSRHEKGDKVGIEKKISQNIGKRQIRVEKMEMQKSRQQTRKNGL